MKVLIVSAWRDRYQGDERARPFPSLSAIHLAALCPPGVEVEVRHEQMRAVDPETVTADLVAITATTGGSGRMYELADALRARGHAVVLGGPHVSLCPGEALLHAAAVAVGEGGPAVEAPGDAPGEPEADGPGDAEPPVPVRPRRK